MYFPNSYFPHSSMLVAEHFCQYHKLSETRRKRATCLQEDHWPSPTTKHTINVCFLNGNVRTLMNCSSAGAGGKQNTNQTFECNYFWALKINQATEQSPIQQKLLNLCTMPVFGVFGGSVVKNLPVNAGDAGSVPGSGRSPGEGNSNPLQYSCLGNPIGRGAWWATAHRGAKESGMT